MYVDTRFVYATPFVAMVIVAIGLALRGRRTPQRRSGTSDRLAFGTIAGLGIAVVCGTLFVHAAIDRQRYDAAKSCRSLSVDSGSDGTCRLAQMTIERTYLGNGRSPRRHFVLGARDGSTTDVAIAASRRGSVSQGFLADDDRYATVQFFGDRAVLVETRSGLDVTTQLPARRMRDEATLAIVGSFAGLACLAGFVRSVMTIANRAS